MKQPNQLMSTELAWHANLLVQLIQGAEYNWQSFDTRRAPLRDEMSPVNPLKGQLRQRLFRGLAYSDNGR